MSHRLILPCVAIIASFIYTSTDANAQQRLHDSIASLSPYIGEWEGKMDAYGDRPAGNLRVRCESVGGGGYLHFTVNFSPQGSDQPITVESVLIAFSGRTKSPHAWCFAHLAQADSEVQVAGTRLTIEDLSYAHANGDESARTVSYQLDEEQQFVIKITDVNHAGQQMPDWPTITLKRKP